MKTFERTRPAVGAMALGVARAAYEYALDYAQQREQFGRKIADFQAIAFKLADMKTRVDAARLLVWRAGWMARNNKPFTNAEGSMAKLVASETAVYVTDEAIQILGGNGYTRDYPVERMSLHGAALDAALAALTDSAVASEPSLRGLAPHLDLAPLTTP